MNETIITIESFEPFTITWPDVEVFTGPIIIELPDMEVKFNLELLSDLIPGLHARSHGKLFCLRFDLGEAEMTVGQMAEFLHKSKSDLKEMYQISQAELLKLDMKL